MIVNIQKTKIINSKQTKNFNTKTEKLIYRDTNSQISLLASHNKCNSKIFLLIKVKNIILESIESFLSF